MIAGGVCTLPRLVIGLALLMPPFVPEKTSAEPRARPQVATPVRVLRYTHPAAPVEAGRVTKRRRVPAKQISERLDRFLAGRPGPVSAMVEDLTTGRVYRYRPGERLITASTAKVQILMGLLLRTPWRKLPGPVRHDADLMIRHSDNHAADRLWLRIGGAAGFTEAGRRFGLRHTQGVPGDCVDLYCWGITRTSVEDQVRLMRGLVSGKSPLAAKERAQALRLMGAVAGDQDWGVSAAACEGERVHLKNGWLRRVSTKRWATVSVGLIRGHGHDYAVAVLTEGSTDVRYGIATVEGIAQRVMRSFRRCSG
ncbi:serine hydrolase [Nonomuraea spiralis]|uniref:serine hydrolase n=1 Tax=Nonomuraea spiralis TaxID=46182 RepID=UPI0037B76BAE